MGDVIEFKRHQPDKKSRMVPQDPIASRIDHINGLPPAERIEITAHHLRLAIDDVLAPAYHDLLEYGGGGKPLSLQGRSLKSYLAQDLIGQSLDDRVLVGLHGLAYQEVSCGDLMKRYHELRQFMRALSEEAASLRLTHISKISRAKLEADLIYRAKAHLVKVCRFVLTAVDASGSPVEFNERSRLLVALARAESND